MARSGPTTEQGSVRPDLALPGWGILGTRAFVDDGEYVPELQWPTSVRVFERMKADAQVEGLLRAVKLPIQRYRWQIDPNGARAASVKALSDDLDLPIKGKPAPNRRRRRGRFSFKQHLQDALHALEYGHYFFEQVGEVGDDGLWHLRKLAVRHPRSISEINVAPDGGLDSIRQQQGSMDSPIKVDRLVAYVWDMEAGNWAGRSLIRSCYRNWLIKDRLLRVDAIKHERSGMGIPVAEAPPGASPEERAELAQMMQAMKVTEGGGGAVPAGSKPMLLGTTGSIPDTIASIRFHNEEMAGAFLAMFKQLGQTQTGARALGESFIDFFALALEAVADWIVETFNEHVIEDWYDWNYGEDSQAALLTYEIDEEGPPPIADLKLLIDSGAVHVDKEIEAELRQRFGLPEMGEEDDIPPQAPPPPVPTPPGQQPSQPVVPPTAAGLRGAARTTAADPAPSLPLPDRKLRRQPYDHEVLATTDFASIDAQLTGALQQLEDEVNLLQRRQIEEIHDLIVQAGGDLTKLSKLQATPVSKDAILSAMQKMAQMGIDQAAKEAERQGITEAKRIALPDVEKLLDNRAAAVDEVLARSLSEAAGRQALRRTAPSVDAATVAQQVKEHLSGLTGSYLHDQLNGALNGAMNTGRKAVMSRNSPKAIYSSELLDDNTCEQCTAIDGTEFLTMAEAEAAYPTGGYGDCLGLERCRGTLVATYTETPSTL